MVNQEQPLHQVEGLKRLQILYQRRIQFLRFGVLLDGEHLKPYDSSMNHGTVLVNVPPTV